MNHEELFKVVVTLESAPSAHILVKSIQENRDLTDDECDDIYNSSMSYNDSETERLIKAMTQDQVESFKDTLRTINEECKESHGDEEYKDLVGDLNIDDILS